MMRIVAPLLILLLLLGLPVLIGAGTYWLMRRWTGLHTACGRCGYSCVGLISLRCPECGSDFRQVGMLPIGVGVRWRTAILIALWVLVVAWAFLTFRNQVIQRIPRVTTGTATMMLAGGRSMAFDRATIRANFEWGSKWFGFGAPDPMPRWVATFESQRTSATAMLTVDRADHTATFQLGENVYQHKGELDAEQLAAWLEMINDKAHKLSIKPEAEYILGLPDSWMQSIRSGPNSGVSFSMSQPGPRVFSSIGSSFNYGSQSVPVASIIVVYSGYFAVALLMALLIVYAGRRRLKKLIAEITASTEQPEVLPVIVRGVESENQTLDNSNG